MQTNHGLITKDSISDDHSRSRVVSAGQHEVVITIDSELDVITIEQPGDEIFSCPADGTRPKLDNLIGNKTVIRRIEQSLASRQPQIFSFLHANHHKHQYQLMCLCVPAAENGHHTLRFQVTTIDHLHNKVSMHPDACFDKSTFPSFPESDPGNGDGSAPKADTLDEKSQGGIPHYAGRLILDTELTILFADSFATALLGDVGRRLNGCNMRDIIPRPLFIDFENYLLGSMEENGFQFELDFSAESGQERKITFTVRPVMFEDRLEAYYLRLYLNSKEGDLPLEAGSSCSLLSERHEGIIDVDRNGTIVDTDYHAETVLKSMNKTDWSIASIVPPRIIRQVLRAVKDKRQYERPLFINVGNIEQHYLIHVTPLYDSSGRISLFRIHFLDTNNLHIGVNTWLDDSFLNSIDLPLAEIGRDLSPLYENDAARKRLGSLSISGDRAASGTTTIAGLISAINAVFKRNSHRTIVYRTDLDEPFDYRIIPSCFADGRCESVVLAAIRKQQAASPQFSRSSHSEGRREALHREDLNKIGSVRIICDSMLLRKHITRLLDNAGIEVVPEYFSPGEADGLGNCKPGEIIIYAIPFLNDESAEDLKVFVEQYPDQRFFAICLSGVRDTEARIINTGVKGVVIDEKDLPILPLALRSVAKGELWCSRSVLSSLLSAGSSRLGASASRQASREKLTHREVEVLKQVGLRKTNKEIAHALGVSYTTIVSHVYNIYKKLGFKNRYEAIEYGINMED